MDIRSRIAIEVAVLVSIGIFSLVYFGGPSGRRIDFNPSREGIYSSACSYGECPPVSASHCESTWKDYPDCQPKDTLRVKLELLIDRVLSSGCFVAVTTCGGRAGASATY